MTRVLPEYVGKGKPTNGQAETGKLLTEPSTVSLDSTHFRILLALLESGSLNDLAILVTNGLAAVEHLDPRSGLGISVEVFALDLLDTVTASRLGRGDRLDVILALSHLDR